MKRLLPILAILAFTALILGAGKYGIIPLGDFEIRCLPNGSAVAYSHSADANLVTLEAGTIRFTDVFPIIDHSLILRGDLLLANSYGQNHPGAPLGQPLVIAHGPGVPKGGGQPPGSLWLRTDAAPGPRFYVKEDAGWTAK